MGHCVRIIIPDRNEAEIAPIIGRIVGRWGRCTIINGVGWDVDRLDGLVRDELKVVDTSIGVWDQVAEDWWHDLASIVRRHWAQDSVFLSVTKEHAELSLKCDERRVIGSEDLSLPALPERMKGAGGD